MRRQKAKRHGCPFRIPSRIQTAMKLFCIKQGNIQVEKVMKQREREKKRVCSRIEES